ncbi:41672_t:CDS:1, partial [Gigaspora margarita]
TKEILLEIRFIEETKNKEDTKVFTTEIEALDSLIRCIFHYMKTI